MPMGGGAIGIGAIGAPARCGGGGGGGGGMAIGGGPRGTNGIAPARRLLPAPPPLLLAPLLAVPGLLPADCGRAP